MANGYQYNPGSLLLLTPRLDIAWLSCQLSQPLPRGITVVADIHWREI